MRIVRKPLVNALCVALLVLASALASAQSRQQVDLGELDGIARQELKDTNTPGAAIAIVSSDRVVYVRGFGVASVETGAPVTPEMLFRLGSTTKMFTAAAVASLAEEGKLRLDEPIGSYVQRLDPAIARVTAHQLLSHSAGLIDEAVMFGPHDDPALGEGVRAMKDTMFFADPGRVFSYSNPGFWVAGFVAESVAGRPYADVMAERLFAPLGMTRTTLRPTVAMTYPLAQGHDTKGKEPPFVIRPAADNVANWPAGSIFSSVDDLSRFVIAFLNGGRIDGKPALSPSLIARLSTPYVDEPGRANPKYGYGLTIVTRRGVRFVEHGGSRSGYGSFISMAPDHKLGIIVLANRTGQNLSKTIQKAAELLLPLEPEAARTAGSPLAMTPDEVAKYAGRYRQRERDPGIEIVATEGGLAMKTGTQEVAVAKVGSNRFELVRTGQPPQDVFFVLGADGRAEFVYRGSRALKRVE